MFQKEVDTLIEFLNMSISDSTAVFNKFSTLTNAKLYSEKINSNNRFLYISGYRKDKVTLVAHADTIWQNFNCNQELEIDNNIIKGKNKFFGIGADDRAGCAIIWELRNLGHNILITDGEEYGATGAKFLIKNFPEILKDINNSQFLLELDRCGNSDYKTYKLPVSDTFKNYIESNTKFTCPDNNCFSDIAILSNSICGVNLSVGYYNEHHPFSITDNKYEYLNIDDWLNTYNIVKKMLSVNKIDKYPLLSKFNLNFRS